MEVGTPGILCKVVCRCGNGSGVAAVSSRYTKLTCILHHSTSCAFCELAGASDRVPVARRSTSHSGRTVAVVICSLALRGLGIMLQDRPKHAR